MNTAEDIIKDKQSDIVSISWDQTVHQACLEMVSKKIGAILVKIGDHMSSPLKTAPHSTRIHKLTEMFLGLFLRHLPIEKDGEFIGLLSIGDVLRASLINTDHHLKEINAFITWDYYENWREGRIKQP